MYSDIDWYRSSLFVDSFFISQYQLVIEGIKIIRILLYFLRNFGLSEKRRRYIITLTV
jgi:hypothetical protein